MLDNAKIPIILFAKLEKLPVKEGPATDIAWREAYDEGKFLRAVVATRAYTAKTSTFIKIEGTCYSHVVLP
jgi:hypothetical protein